MENSTPSDSIAPDAAENSNVGSTKNSNIVAVPVSIPGTEEASSPANASALASTSTATLHLPDSGAGFSVNISPHRQMRPSFMFNNAEPNMIPRMPLNQHGMAELQTQAYHNILKNSQLPPGTSHMPPDHNRFMIDQRTIIHGPNFQGNIPGQSPKMQNMPQVSVQSLPYNVQNSRLSISGIHPNYQHPTGSLVQPRMPVRHSNELNTIEGIMLSSKLQQSGGSISTPNGMSAVHHSHLYLPLQREGGNTPTNSTGMTIPPMTSLAPLRYSIPSSANVSTSHNQHGGPQVMSIPGNVNMFPMPSSVVLPSPTYKVATTNNPGNMMNMISPPHATSQGGTAAAAAAATSNNPSDQNAPATSTSGATAPSLGSLTTSQLSTATLSPSSSTTIPSASASTATTATGATMTTSNPGERKEYVNAAVVKIYKPETNSSELDVLIGTIPLGIEVVRHHPQEMISYQEGIPGDRDNSIANLKRAVWHKFKGPVVQPSSTPPPAQIPSIPVSNHSNTSSTSNSTSTATAAATNNNINENTILNTTNNMLGSLPLPTNQSPYLFANNPTLTNNATGLPLSMPNNTTTQNQILAMYGNQRISPANSGGSNANPMLPHPPSGPEGIPSILPRNNTYNQAHVLPSGGRGGGGGRGGNGNGRFGPPIFPPNVPGLHPHLQGGTGGSSSTNFQRIPSNPSSTYDYQLGGSAATTPVAVSHKSAGSAGSGGHQPASNFGLSSSLPGESREATGSHLQQTRGMSTRGHHASSQARNAPSSRRQAFLSSQDPPPHGSNSSHPASGTGSIPHKRAGISTVSLPHDHSSNNTNSSSSSHPSTQFNRNHPYHTAATSTTTTEDGASVPPALKKDPKLPSRPYIRRRPRSNSKDVVDMLVDTDPPTPLPPSSATPPSMKSTAAAYTTAAMASDYQYPSVAATLKRKATRGIRGDSAGGGIEGWKRQCLLSNNGLEDLTLDEAVDIIQSKSRAKPSATETATGNTSSLVSSANTETWDNPPPYTIQQLIQQLKEEKKLAAEANANAASSIQDNNNSNNNRTNPTAAAARTVAATLSTTSASGTKTAAVHSRGAGARRTAAVAAAAGGLRKGSRNSRKDHLDTDSIEISNDHRTTSKSATAAASTDREEEEDEEWVLCDLCSKWRKLPSRSSPYFPKSLPERWSCSINTWNSKLTCSSPEETANTSSTVNTSSTILSSDSQTDIQTEADKEKLQRRNAEHVKLALKIRIWLRRMKSGTRFETLKLTGVTFKDPNRNSIEERSEHEVDWLRCASPSCGKWRACLKSMNGKIVKEKYPLWYCWMNSWDDTKSSCSAPQEGLNVHDRYMAECFALPTSSVSEATSLSVDSEEEREDENTNNINENSNSNNKYKYDVADHVASGSSKPHSSDTSTATRAHRATAAAIHDMHAQEDGQTLVLQGVTSRGRAVRSRWSNALTSTAPVRRRQTNK